MAASTGDMSILDNVDFDAVTRFNGESVALPNGIVRAELAVEQLRAQRAEQQQRQEQLATLQQAADIGETMAGAADKAGITQTQGESNV